MRPSPERQVVDFFSHLIYGETRRSGHYIGFEADRERFEVVAQQVERLEGLLGRGTIKGLYGVPWTVALERSSKDDFFKSAFFERSLFFLEESLGSSKGPVSLSAASVGAVIAGRMLIGISRESAGRNSLAQLQRLNINWAQDGTMERLTAGLIEVTGRFDAARAEALGMYFGSDLPNPKYAMMEVRIDPQALDGGGTLSADGFTVIRPLGAGAAWVDQLTAEALSVPESFGREFGITRDH